MTAPTRAGYVEPIVSGLLSLAVALLPWTWLSQINLRVRPDLPWSALASVLYIGVLLLWLGGWGPPRRTAIGRQRRLRLWPPQPQTADGLSAGAMVLVLGLVYAAWIAISAMSPTPDLSEFPTTAVRWSMFLMGGLTAGVVEEVAFRGYMQTGLEKHDPANAIWITSMVFALSHITQGLGAVIALGPGLFVASALYGMLARRTGTILPGMALHVLGDLSRVYLGVLHGDASLLFVR